MKVKCKQTTNDPSSNMDPIDVLAYISDTIVISRFETLTKDSHILRSYELSNYRLDSQGIGRDGIIDFRCSVHRRSKNLNIISEENPSD